jgi:uncharacterized membrane protein YkvA (DUF1232 family)
MEFHVIFRYTPQSIELEYKLKPFIPDFIPAVGDIDAFLKVSIKIESLNHWRNYKHWQWWIYFV